MIHTYKWFCLIYSRQWNESDGAKGRTISSSSSSSSFSRMTASSTRRCRKSLKSNGTHLAECRIGQVSYIQSMKLQGFCFVFLEKCSRCVGPYLSLVSISPPLGACFSGLPTGCSWSGWIWFSNAISPKFGWTQQMTLRRPVTPWIKTFSSAQGLWIHANGNGSNLGVPSLPPKKNGFVWKCWVNIPNEIAI